MKKQSLAFVKVLLVLIILVSSASADWINLSGAMSAKNIAEFHVNDDHLKVVLEIFVQDLPTFMDLIPNDMLKQGIQRLAQQERMRSFSSEILRVVVNEKILLGETYAKTYLFSCHIHHPDTWCRCSRCPGAHHFPGPGSE